MQRLNASQLAAVDAALSRTLTIWQVQSAPQAFHQAGPALLYPLLDFHLYGT